MKKIFALIVVFTLVLGLTASAWAADEITNIQVTPSGTIAYTDSATINGYIPLNNPYKTGDPDGEYGTYSLTNDAGVSITYETVGSNRSFQLTVTGAKIVSLGGKVTLTLTKQFEIWQDGELQENGPREEVKEVNISVAAELSNDVTMKSVTLTSSGATVGSNNEATPSTTSSAPTVINVTSAVSGSITVSVVVAPNDSSATTTLSMSSFILAATGASQDFNVVVTAPNGDTRTYYYRATRVAGSTNNSLSKVAIMSSSTELASTTTQFPTSATSAYGFSTPNANSTVTVTATPADNTATIAYYNSHSGGTATSTLSLTVGTAQQFRVVVTSQSGAVATYYYTVTRQAAAVSLATAVNIRTGSSSSSSGSLVVSGSAITSTSGAQTLTIPASYDGTSNFYAHVTLASGVSLSNTVTNSNNIVLLSLPSGTASKDFTLTFSAGGATHYKTITLERAGSTNTLSNLYIKKNVTSSTGNTYVFTTSPSSFSSTTRSYTVYVESDTDYIYIYPTKNSSSDDISISGTYYSLSSNNWSNSGNGSGYFVVRLNSSGTNTVYINFNNSATNRYTLTISREAEVVRNASLNSLSVRSGSSSSSSTYNLSPSFTYTRLNYDVDLNRTVSEVYLHFSAYSSGANVTVSSNATWVSNGVYRATITSGQSKTVTITVSNSGNTTRYNINLNSGGSSTKARLSRIRVASTNSTSSSYQYTMLPAFDPLLTEYTVLIPYDNSTNRDVWVQGTLNNSGDSMTIDGSSTNNDDWKSFSIRAGNTSRIKVTVDDNDGNTTTYNLNLVAAPSGASTDANLSSLSLRSGSSGSTTISFSPSFSSGTSNYTATSIANNVDTIRVYADGYSAAGILVNDVPVSGSYATINLAEGDNDIDVTVYAEDCKTYKTYYISINRGYGGSSDSSLSGLELRTGASTSQTLNLIPAFVKTTLNYKANVGDDVTQVSFRPTATDSNAVIRLQSSTLTSGQWTGYNVVNSGTNTFVFSVTSPDGVNTSLYTVEVTRGLSVVESTWTFRVNGAGMVCAVYNVNGNNYFKLRDIAYSLRGTPKHFNVTYNAATRVVSMVSNQEYSPIGGEMAQAGKPGKYQLSNQTMMVDSRNVNLTAYNIDGNNYFMLREIGALFNFGVTYSDATRIVDINTSVGYTPE